MPDTLISAHALPMLCGYAAMRAAAIIAIGQDEAGEVGRDEELSGSFGHGKKVLRSELKKFVAAVASD